MKKVLSQCLPCKTEVNIKPSKQLMGHLPREKTLVLQPAFSCKEMFFSCTLGPMLVSRISEQDLHYYYDCLLIILSLSLSLLLMLLLLLLLALLLLSSLLLLFGSSHVYKDMFLNVTKKIFDEFEKNSSNSKRGSIQIF